MIFMPCMSLPQILYIELFLYKDNVLLERTSDYLTTLKYSRGALSLSDE